MSGSLHDSPQGLTSTQLGLLKTILARHLTSGAKVWMFGSRIRGTHRLSSDLDVLIDCTDQDHFKTFAMLQADLDESDLPFMVDLVDARDVSVEFDQRISADKVPLDLTTAD